MLLPRQTSCLPTPRPDWSCGGKESTPALQLPLPCRRTMPRASPLTKPSSHMGATSLAQQKRCVAWLWPCGCGHARGPYIHSLYQSCQCCLCQLWVDGLLPQQGSCKGWFHRTGWWADHGAIAGPWVRPASIPSRNAPPLNRLCHILPAYEASNKGILCSCRRLIFPTHIKAAFRASPTGAMCTPAINGGDPYSTRCST